METGFIVIRGGDMSSKRREPRDEDNSSFGSSPSMLEELKPGLESSDGKQRNVTEGHHRLSPRDNKDIPREPLAKRIRNAPKED
jgi:hypothetical protein